MIMSDGTVIPSYLGVESRGSTAGSQDILNDYVFRMGEVKKIIYPNDPLSYGNKTVEYEVEVQYKSPNGTYVTSTYRGVTISTMFGGIADRFHATLRADSNPSGNNQPVGKGSKVLLLCLSGDQKKAIILGGIEDPLSTRTEQASTGHNLFFEFNGITFTINKDGEAQMQFMGATQADGTLDPNAQQSDSGANILFNKNGDIQISDTNNYIIIDHRNKKIRMLADQEWDVNVNGKLQFTVNKDIGIVSQSGQVEIDAKGNVKIKSAGVLVGAATDYWMLGTTFRTDLSTMNTTYISSLQSLAEAALQAATALEVAAGLNAIPVYGGLMALSGFEAVAASLDEIGIEAQALATVTQNMEAKATNHTSKVNKGD